VGRKKPVALPGLGVPGRRLWDEVTAVYELAPAEAETLRQAAVTVDLIACLDEALFAQPAMIAGSVGQLKVNPLIATIADQRRLLDGLLRSLNLPMPAETEGRRRAPLQQAAAQARWRQEKERRLGQVAAE
jgi:hypothetical protein